MIGGGSLQRRLRFTLGGLALSALVGISLLIWLSGSAHSRSLEATRAFVVDERASDLITRGVLRQLVVAVAFPTVATEEERDLFLASGSVVSEELRRYLLSTLTPEERLRLAEVREAHQRFEVQAVHAAELFARGGGAEADAALAATAGLAHAFIEGIEGFFAIRLEALDRLQRTQEALQATLFRAAVLLGIGLVGVAMLAAWELNRRVVRPLATLSHVTERIAAGDLDARLPARGDDEFRHLAERFNQMGEALQRREDQLTRALVELEESQSELVTSETLKAVGRMSAGFAHEINNPLTSVLGYAELLTQRITTDPPPGPEEVEELLTPIVSEASRARALVENLIQVAHPPKGPTDAIPLRETLGVVVELRDYTFQQAGLELIVDGVPEVSVRVDPQFLHGVFLQLINNAFDALREEGRGALTITGTVRESAGEVELDFTDTGPGLTHPDHVFEPFFTTKPVGEGTGLGLSVVHHFVTLFGGSIRAGNTAEGGAQFVLRLPLADPDAASAEEGKEAGSSAPAAPADLPASRWPDPATPADAPAIKGERQTATVLVVEDEPQLLKLQARVLKQAGLRAVTVSSVAEAREVLKDERVDAIVSDVRMPGESGVDLYREVRDTYPELLERFLFVTGDASVPELDEIVQAQGEIVIRKPFRMEEYIKRVRETIAS